LIESGLFRELCKPEILKIGWHLAQHDSRDDFISDPVGYEDFSGNLTKRLSFLVEEIRNKRYRPRYLIDIDLPKSGLNVRPGNVLPIEESTILHSIIYLLAPRIDPKLEKEVYSYRLHKDWKKRVKKGKGLFRTGEKEIPFLNGKTLRSIDPIEPWYEAWPAFYKERIITARENGFTHLTKTDIASYFENIDLRILETQLRNLLPNEGEIIELLMRILESWTRDTSLGAPIGRGIPQGNNISSFLGNIYLLALDKSLVSFCKRKDAIWYRYVDDVEVYSKNEETSRDVVYEINESLRKLYLNLQGSKTEILSGNKLEIYLNDTQSQIIDIAWEIVNKSLLHSSLKNKEITKALSTLRPIARDFRCGLPNSVFSLNNQQSRILRRLMTVYGRSMRPYLINVAFASLSEPPELRMLLKSSRYLRSMEYKFHTDYVERLVSMLEQDIFPVPFQSAVLLDTIRFLHPHEPGNKIWGRITRWALNVKRDWPIRQKACEALQTLPSTEAYCYSQALNCLNDEHPFVRRAACSLLTRGPVEQVRKKIDELLFHPDPSLGRLALFWFNHLKNSDFARSQIKRFSKSNKSDTSIIYIIPHLWLLRCSANRDTITELRTLLKIIEKTKSEKIKWHIRKLLVHTAWVDA
jgi:hypothetical protein